jgi:hypothetical protein
MVIAKNTLEHVGYCLLEKPINYLITVMLPRWDGKYGRYGL